MAGRKIKNMNNFTKILNTIRRPFQQELRKGCRDDVVVNGLGNYVQLWVKNGHALGLAAVEKEMLTGLGDLFEHYTRASPTERQRTLEEATKRIEVALGHSQKISELEIPTTVPQTRSGLDTPPTSRKNAQTELLPLFQQTVNRPESTPPKRETATEPTHQRVPKGNLPLFQNTGAPPSQSEKVSTEKSVASVPISDIPVSTGSRLA